MDNDLRREVAVAMGWTNFVQHDTALLGRPPQSPIYQRSRVPNYGAPCWRSTGQIIDEMRRRRGCWVSLIDGPDGQYCQVLPLPCEKHPSGRPTITMFAELDGRTIHEAVAHAFVEAARKESA